MLEEFGTTTSNLDEEERKVVFSVVFDKLIEAKRAGRPFMGAMFWNAALWGERYIAGTLEGGMQTSAYA